MTRRLTRGTRLEVHHIIEVRIILGNKVIRGKIPSVRKAPAVIVTHDQHVSITNSLRSNLPYQKSDSRLRWHKLLRGDNYYAFVWIHLYGFQHRYARKQCDSRYNMA